MRLTRTEVISYVGLVIAFGAISIVARLLPFFFPEYFENYESFAPSKWVEVVSWAGLFAVNITSAFFIHRSEKRLGNTTNIIWQLLGLVLGFVGFVGYALWGLLEHTGLFVAEEDASEESES